ncbi:SPOR domain-containing protein [Hymenobacter sp. DG25B]|uniref:HU domain-containing protein n=1 Tax=Hymenobacter sp. DG25B TaxID=1385664 RepID=UPI0009E3EF0E|nr:SPOR domain-containing protein [Hymenobacter sp. DG25B]
MSFNLLLPDPIHRPLQLSDHIRALLREHDCVIIPDFGGLISDYSPAHIHPVRHTLAPPDKRVAFNQALTRNDGLLVDALSNALRISSAQARQMVRDAVARLQSELAENHRTELPGIGIFRYAAGRGLDFEYTGTQNLLSASFGLPELLSRPVRATDALIARERPTEVAPLLAVTRRRLGKRVFNTLAAVVVSGLVLSANYMLAQRFDYLPASLQFSSTDAVAQAPADTPAPVMRQQAALAQTSWDEERVSEPVAEVALPEAKPEVTPAPAAPAPAAVAATSTAAPVSVAKAAQPVSSATISTITNRWYVVTAALTNAKAAEQLRKQYISKGIAVKLLTPRRGNRFVQGTRYYRISVADFADKASAKSSLPTLRKKFGNDILATNY